MKKDLIEGLKEIVRTALMAVIPLVIIDLQSGQFNYNNWIIAGAIALLSGVDKWLHKADINLYEKVGVDETKGLLPI